VEDNAGEAGRRSVRLKGHDYTGPGGYFVTIVAFRRLALFGEIAADGMQLNALGKIVRQEWFRTPAVRPEEGDLDGWRAGGRENLSINRVRDGAKRRLALFLLKVVLLAVQPHRRPF